MYYKKYMITSEHQEVKHAVFERIARTVQQRHSDAVISLREGKVAKTIIWISGAGSVEASGEKLERVNKDTFDSMIKPAMPSEIDVA